MHYTQVWWFPYEHRGIVAYLLGWLSGGVVFSLNVSKLWKENKKLKLELEESARDLEMRMLTEATILCACYAKQRAGTYDVVFNGQDLRWFLGSHADKVYAVIGRLKLQGRAKDATIPGEWTIN